MLQNEGMFVSNDGLTVELTKGNLLEGEIPRYLRLKGETKGAANRRRTKIVNLINKYPLAAKAYLEEFNKSNKIKLIEAEKKSMLENYEQISIFSQMSVIIVEP